MNRTPLLGAMALAAAGLLGCGHVELHEIVLRAPEPPAAPAQVYFVGQSPGRPYDEVALLQAIGWGDDADMEDLARALSVRAGRLGCDAVVRVHVDQGWTRAHAFGVCVRWSPTAPPSAAPRPPLVPPPAPTPPPARPATPGSPPPAPAATGESL